MQSEIERKQAYLREQIIDKNYSPEEFAEFLLTLKADGGDLEIWTLKELILAVKKFTQSKNAEAADQKINEEKLEELQKRRSIEERSKAKEVKEKEEEVDFKKFPQLFYSKHNLYDWSFRKRVKCQKIQKYLPRDVDRFNIIVDKPQIRKSGGIFGFGGVNKLWFAIRNNVANKEVMREDEDFQWLRNTYLRMYPGRIIPPLQQMRENAIDDKQARQIRAQMIKRFLQAVSKDAQIFNTNLTITFLTADSKAMESFKKRINSTSSIRVLTAMANFNGYVQTEISPPNHKFLQAAGDFSVKSAKIYDQLRSISNSIAKNYQDLTHNIYKFGEGFAKLQEAYSRSIEKSPELLNPTLSNCFINLNNMLVEFGRSYNAQRLSMQRNFSFFFRFNKLQSESAAFNVHERLKIQNEYLDFKSDLLRRKQLVYDNPLKWQLPSSFLATIKPHELSKQEAMKIMLPKDTDKQNRMKQWLSFINRTMELSYQSLLESIASRYVTTFQALGTEFLVSHKTQGEVYQRMSGSIAQ